MGGNGLKMCVLGVQNGQICTMLLIWPLWTPSGDLKIRPHVNIVTLELPANFEVPTKSPKCPTDPGTARSRGDPAAPSP
jgi:hypothetical protein